MRLNVTNEQKISEQQFQKSEFIVLTSAAL